MEYPPLLTCATVDEYRAHFEGAYCRGPIRTFDGIAVRFRKRCFDHAFYESTNRDSNKDTFSQRRAERMDWIKVALEDPQSERYQGWDKRRKRRTPSRRVTLVMGNYVVVIALKNPREAVFITAFVAEMSTVAKIREGHQ